jgi:hypothetical protein
MENKQCADCRDGDHENYDDDVVLVFVRDPETKKLHKRSYMCHEHRCAYRDDGYEVDRC